MKGFYWVAILAEFFIAIAASITSNWDKAQTALLFTIAMILMVSDNNLRSG